MKCSWVGCPQNGPRSSWTLSLYGLSPSDFLSRLVSRHLKKERGLCHGCVVATRFIYCSLMSSFLTFGVRDTVLRDPFKFVLSPLLSFPCPLKSGTMVSMSFTILVSDWGSAYLYFGIRFNRPLDITSMNWSTSETSVIVLQDPRDESFLCFFILFVGVPRL